MAFALILCNGLNAQVIPTSRLANWSSVGVPGGIPTNRTSLINVTNSPYNADKTGSLDATGAIQAAINAASPGQVVYIPAGTYKIASQISIGPSKSNITVRGDGDSTLLKPTMSGGCVFYVGSASDYDWAYPSGGIGITSGLTKGSTTLGVSSTSGLAVGQIIRITELNDPSVPVIHVSGNQSQRHETTRITAIGSNSITIFPELHWDLNSSLNPRIFVARQQCNGIGIEDLYMDDAGAGGHPYMIWLEQCYGCWLKNVHSHLASNYHFFIDDSVQCEMRHCYVDDAKSHVSNGSGLIFWSSSDCLIEDNIFVRCFPHIEMSFGSSGNVIAYNLAENNYTDSGLMGVSYDCNHGPHNSFNLFEGNIGSMFQNDGYYGSASEITVFRNWFHGDNPTLTQNSKCVDLCRLGRNFSVVGNILGKTGLTFTYDAGTVNPTSYTVRYIFRLGYPNMGNGSYNGSFAPPYGSGYQELDTAVRSTAIIKGNWNSVSNSVPSSESLGSDTLPNSLYLSAKPSWFGNLAWPPFDPSRPNQNFAAIPAGYRYLNKTDPPQSTTATPSPTPAPSATPAPTASPSPSASPAPSPTPAPSASPTPTPVQVVSPTPTPVPTSSPTSTGTAAGTTTTGTSGLVAAYAFDEGSGTTLTDSSGNGNNGTITGATWTQGKNGGGLQFNGIDSYVIVANSPSLGFSTAMTLEAWVYPSAAQTGWHAIMHKEADAWYLEASSATGTNVPAGGGILNGTEQYVPGTTSLPVNQWSHVAVTYDGSTMILYVNGAPVASKNLTGAIQANSNPLRIGGNTYANQFFAGVIDNIRIYNKALPQSQIQTDMNTPVSSGGATSVPAPTASPTPTPTPVPTASPTPTPTPVPTASPAPTPTPVPTASPAPTPTPVPTASPTPTPTPSPTASPTPTPTPSPTASPTPTAATTISAPSILWWKLSSSSGNVVSASVGANGSTNGSWASNTRTGSGYVLNLNGSSQYARSSSTITFGTQVVTVEMWVYPNSLSTNGTQQILFETSPQPNSNPATFGAWSAWGSIYLQMYDAKFNGRIVHFANPSSGRWHHLAMVFDNSTAAGSMTAYVDGVAQATTVDMAAKTSPATFAPQTLFVGARAAAKNFFPGRIADLRIYNRALSASEVQASMTGP